jgi:hypothetical protein
MVKLWLGDARCVRLWDAACGSRTGTTSAGESTKLERNVFLTQSSQRAQRREGGKRRGERGRGLSVEGLEDYTAGMANQNALAGVVPQVVHPVNDGETAVTQYVEKIEGEVALDSYVRAQTSAPEVVKRITELENSLQRLASAVMTSEVAVKVPGLRATAEEAKLVLKNRLEIDEKKHRFHSELGVIRDEPGET